MSLCSSSVPDLRHSSRSRLATPSTKPEPLRPIYRFVCSWATSAVEVDEALAAVSRAIEG